MMNPTRPGGSYSPPGHWCSSEARREAWVWGCVQLCDDVRRKATISIRSLRFPHPGPSGLALTGGAMAKRQRKHTASLHILQPDAAGADIGAEEIFVAVPPDRDDEPVRRFPTFTRDLHGLADWLQQRGIRTIAMESTSVYWIPLHQILEERGLEVYLVNAQYVKNVPGRKTDVSDCQWIQYLHSVGLLRASFRPPAAICAIRSHWRHRENLIQMGAQHVRHMQKALDQMNLQVHHVLSDITGVSGQRILDAILEGDRDPVKLAQLCHGGVKSSQAKIAKALEGDYRPEHLFALKQSLAGYRSYQKMIADVDKEIEANLKGLPTAEQAKAELPERKEAPLSAPTLRTHVVRSQERTIPDLWRRLDQRSWY